MGSKTAELRRMLEARLVTRAEDDPDFRNRLLTAPREAFEEEFGRPLFTGLELRVLEEPLDTITIVLPRAPTPDGALSDAELDGVAGGGWYRDLKILLGISSEEITPPDRTAVAGVRG
jgi:hypothetical protein